MMRIVYYKSKTERLTALKKANALKETMIHDDFLDSNQNATDGKSGKLTFDILPDKINPDLEKRKVLSKKLIDNSLTFEGYKELLRLG